MIFNESIILQTALWKVNLGIKAPIFLHYYMNFISRWYLIYSAKLFITFLTIKKKKKLDGWEDNDLKEVLKWNSLTYFINLFKKMKIYD
jgi:hypothetical protein